VSATSQSTSAYVVTCFLGGRKVWFSGGTFGARHYAKLYDTREEARAAAHTQSDFWAVAERAS
jgi:hypothetical protein